MNHSNRRILPGIQLKFLLTIIVGSVVCFSSFGSSLHNPPVSVQTFNLNSTMEEDAPKKIGPLDLGSIGWRIQVANVATEKAAYMIWEDLDRLFLGPVDFKRINDYYTILLGNYLTAEEADSALSLLHERGYRDSWRVRAYIEEGDEFRIMVASASEKVRRETYTEELSDELSDSGHEEFYSAAPAVKPKEKPVRQKTVSEPTPTPKPIQKTSADLATTQPKTSSQPQKSNVSWEMQGNYKNGYRIQIMYLTSLTEDEVAELAKKAETKLVYPVYVVSGKGNKRFIRVGDFASESEARTALSQIQMSGYGDAYLVKDRINN